MKGIIHRALRCVKNAMKKDIILSEITRSMANKIAKSRAKKDFVIGAIAVGVLFLAGGAVYLFAYKSLYCFVACVTALLATVLVLMEDLSFKKATLLYGQCSCGKELLVSAKAEQVVCKQCGTIYEKVGDTLKCDSKMGSFVDDINQVCGDEAEHKCADEETQKVCCGE